MRYFKLKLKKGRMLLEWQCLVERTVFSQIPIFISLYQRNSSLFIYYPSMILTKVIVFASSYWNLALWSYNCKVLSQTQNNFSHNYVNDLVEKF